MNVVLRWLGREYEIGVQSDDPATTVGDLGAALVGDNDLEIAVDGRLTDATTPVAELAIGDGSVLELAAAADPRWLGRLVEVEGGPVGIDVPLTASVVTIGAAPADVVIGGVSGRAVLSADLSGAFAIRCADGVAVTVDGRPVGSEVLPVNPGSRIVVGNRVLSIHTNTRPVSGPTAAFNRPPRLVAVRRIAELKPPAPPEKPRDVMRFGWGALIVPVILGLGMAILIHPRMAIFALFSPAMLLANWMEDKRRVRRERRESGEVFADSLARFRLQVAKAHRTEALHRRAQVVAPHELEIRARRIESRLWERRRGHDDFMRLPVGIGCVRWEPQLLAPVDAETAGVLHHYSELHDVPVSVSLSSGDVVGIAGERTVGLGIVRQILLQAAVHHGPADLAVSIFTERPNDWDWAKWLPHVLVDVAGRRRLAGDPEEIAEVVSLLPAERTGPCSPLQLLVVDLPDLSAGPRSLIREAIQAGKDRDIAAIAVGARALDLPSLVTTIISVEQAQARIRLPDGTGVGLAPWIAGAPSARCTARALARIRDPEAAMDGAGMPGVVHLDALLGLGDDPVASIASAWRSASTDIGVPIGVTADGPLLVDLVADGPHALLGGTTGAGKSELLRTLVASLAASVSPEVLNFVLVDYKGGSAFDACAALPHTVGVVTDLDEHLARRALICLEAELRYREERLRSAAVSDIISFPQTGTHPLPRLLVVVDEFAALAMELPDFMDSLVGIAQRGRSLGVHLLLATQRPNGVISDNIKANTNLRVALRVQDLADSVDVIGSGAAAEIGRAQPGRGLARRGPGDVIAFQTALVTGSSRSSQGAQVAVQPFVFGSVQPSEGLVSPTDPSAPTDLETIVDAATEAAARLGLRPRRLPWPDALPEIVYRDDLVELVGSSASAFGLADEPHRQRQVAASWSPAAGNLLIYGLSGSGTSSTLATLAIAAGADADPNRLHMYVLDFDDQLLHPLNGLPHVGAVVTGNDRERQLRLLRRLGVELQERRQALAQGSAAGSTRPTIVTLLDNYGAFVDSFGDPGDIGIHNLVARLVADGPGVGMMTVIAAKHAGDIPTRVASLVATRLVFRLADRYDYTGLGVPMVEPPAVAGRAFESGTGREVQVALPHPDGLPAAVSANTWHAARCPPWSIDVLPSEVPIADFISAGRISTDEWFLPLGIGDSSLVPVGLVLRDGDHALITGPPRSGKTTALATLASVAKVANPDLYVVAVLPRRSSLGQCAAVDDVVDVDGVGSLDADGKPCLLLVDDAELVDADCALRLVVTDREPKFRVVASAAAEAIRGLYGHWTQDLRRSRIGCALRPNTLSDGDLWQTQLPRHPRQQFPVGRGYLLADGQAELVQLGRA